MMTVKDKNSEISGIYAYSKSLKKTEFPDKTIIVLTEAQAQLIRENLYTKNEITMTLEEVISNFDKRTNEIRVEGDKKVADINKKAEADRAHLEKEMLKMENRIDKKFLCAYFS